MKNPPVVLTQLDKPKMILSLPSSDFYVLIGGVIAGLFLNHLIVCIGCGVGLFLLKRKMKRYFPRRSLVGHLYHLLPTRYFSYMYKSHSFPDSSIKKYVR